MGKHHTLEEKVEIIRYREQGKTIREVAKAFGISHSAVHAIWCSKDEILAKYYACIQRTGISHASAGIEIIPEETMPRKVSGEDLKKENKALREENEYLKDQVAYLEALYEIIKQDPSSVMKKKDFPRSGKQ